MRSRNGVGVQLWFMSAALIAVLVGLWAPESYAQEVVPLPSPLRFEQVMQLAHEHRAEITASRASARAAAQRPTIVSAPEDPMVIASLDHLPFMLHGADVSLTVEQRFSMSGILANRRNAAEAEAQRLRAEVDRVGLDVALQAANAFLMLRERREMARVLDEQHLLAQQFVRAALARFSSGSGGQSAVVRAEIEVARLAGAQRAIAAEVRAAEAMLNTTLARPADASVSVLEVSAFAELPPSSQSVIETALARRPELRAGRAEISRARADVSVMRSMFAPMAMVRTGAAYTMSDGAGWMLMVGISIPIWRGRLNAGVAEAEAMVEMSRADLQAMQRMIEGEAASSRALVIASRERVLALRDAVIPRARLAMELTLAEYSAGQLPLVSVVEAAQALWTAQGDLVSAEFNLGAAHVRLRRATGEGPQP